MERFELHCAIGPSALDGLGTQGHAEPGSAWTVWTVCTVRAHRVTLSQVQSHGLHGLAQRRGRGSRPTLDAVWLSELRTGEVAAVARPRLRECHQSIAGRVLPCSCVRVPLIRTFCGIPCKNQGKQSRESLVKIKGKNALAPRQGDPLLHPGLASVGGFYRVPALGFR